MPRTAESHCPHCGYRVDAATCVHQADATPKEGDLSICICCRALSVFRADQTLRLPSREELIKIARTLGAQGAPS